MRIEAIAVHQFAPFRAQKCEFGSPGDGGRADVHILVGENGTGKTRLLALLMAACGNRKELSDRSVSPLSTLVVAGIDKNSRLIWSTAHPHLLPLKTPSNEILDEFVSSGAFGRHAFTPVGGLLLVHSNNTVAMSFRSVAAIRDEKLKPMGVVNWGDSNDILMFSRNDNAALCQAVLNMKIRAGMYLAGNPAQREDRTIRMSERLEKTLERITGRPFVILVEQEGADVYAKVQWGNVRMRLNQLPDGLRAIIGWLAACVARLDLLLPNVENPLEQPVILFLDEPETHLHPAWQRKVVPALKSLLPNAQIFVATHSPFVVSSVNEGWIYVLKAEDGGLVKINNPKPCSKGDTYIDAVEDALGLTEWYDPETEEMLAKFRSLRDKALKTFAESDKTEMDRFAKEIAKRSESLAVMMGKELAQFNKKEKSATQ